MDILNYVSKIYYLEYLVKKQKFKVLLDLLFLDRNNYGIIVAIFSKYIYQYMKKYPIYVDVEEAVDDLLIREYRPYHTSLTQVNNLDFLQHLTRLMEIDPDFLYFGLFEAVKNKNYAIIRYLINNRNLDINYIDGEATELINYGDYNHHVTALFLAIYYDDLQMVKFLIEEMGADPNMDVTVQVYKYDNTEFNALQYAIYMERKSIVKYLMDNYDIDYMRTDQFQNNVMEISLQKFMQEGVEQFDTVLVDVVNHPNSQQLNYDQVGNFGDVSSLAQHANFNNVAEAINNKYY